MFRKVLVVIVFAGGSTLPAVSGAGAAAPADHCVRHVTGQRASGELIVGSSRCYATFESAMVAEGVTAWGPGAWEQVSSSGAAAMAFTLATHYDLANFNPANGSTSTVGTGCTGGWLNTSGGWNNRIGSTSQGCPSVIHFDGANRTGAFAVTTGSGGNLGAMDNRTSSIQYT